MKVRRLTTVSATLLCGCLILFCSGCISLSTSAKGLEPQVYDLRGRSYEVTGESEGESSSFRLFWIFPVTPPYKMQEALDEAIALKGGDNLIGVEYYYERQLWIVGTVEIVTVKGKVIRYTD